MKKRSFLQRTCGVLLASALFASCAQKSETVDLTLLYTTDLHGAILPFDFTKNQEAATSLANVYTYVTEAREENEGGVILLDAGDFLQGQPSIYYSNFVDTISEHIQARTMEYVGYDAAAVGNHDIEPGAPVYDRVQEDFDFPWLAANAIDVRTGEPYFDPYTIIERKGIRIAVLGMITPNIEAWLPKYLWQNIEFADMVETAQKWVPIIMKKEKPDLLVGLFHSGANYDAGGNTKDTYMNENGAIPAVMKVDGFDIALLGHDHQEISEVIKNDFGHDVVVLDAQTQAGMMGRVDITMTGRPSDWKKTLTPSIVRMDSYPASEEYAKYFAQDIETVNDFVDSPIGMLTKDLSSKDALYGPSMFMDLIHNAQLEATGADVSFAGVLSTNTVIPKGELTMRHLFSLYKYENLLYTMQLTGEEIDRFLEFGYANQYNKMESADDHLLKFKRDEQGNLEKNPRFGYTPATPSFNYTSAAGIRYEVDVTKDEGDRVRIISMSDGQPFDNNKMYEVAINSYQASGGGGFMFDGLGFTREQVDERTKVASPYDVRKYIADYIKSNKTITPASRNDWKVVPKAYFEKGMKKDAALIQSK